MLTFEPRCAHSGTLLADMPRWLLQGLVIKSRKDLQHHKLAFAHDTEARTDLLSIVRALKPTALIGVSTIAGAFGPDVCAAMADHNPRPIIFPLSNPTHLAEVTFHDAMEWTGGRVLFASGSPFPPLMWQGVERHPAQANNAYVFPAIGHAAILTRARCIPDKVFLLAAAALADMTSLEELERGWLFPPFDGILSASVAIMSACCQYFDQSGLSQRVGQVPARPHIEQSLWVPPSPSKL